MFALRLHKIPLGPVARATKERRYPIWREASKPYNHETEAKRKKDMGEPRFKLGQVVATPSALEALEDAGQLPAEFLRRHVAGDWGDVVADDRRENETSVANGFRILSAYKTTKGVRLWVITEADRTSTCILLPEEY
jgi:hypothetical protein